MNPQAAQNYLRTKVLTATPEQLQLMLYDGALRFGDQARAALQARNFEQSYALITKVQKIVLELTSTLKHDQSPDLCGKLAEIANTGTLYAFLMVAVAVLILRVKEPNRERSFKVPGVWFVAPASILGCAFLFFNLPFHAMLVFPVWGGVGLLIYFAYSRSRSHLGRGIVEVVDDIEGEETMVPIDPPRAS